MLKMDDSCKQAYALFLAIFLGFDLLKKFNAMK